MLFHVLFQLWSSHKSFSTQVTFVWFLFVTSMAEVVSLPVMRKLQTLLFIAHFTDQKNFHVRIVETLDVLQTGRVTGFGSSCYN